MKNNPLPFEDNDLDVEMKIVQVPVKKKSKKAGIVEMKRTPQSRKTFELPFDLDDSGLDDNSSVDSTKEVDKPLVIDEHLATNSLEMNPRGMPADENSPETVENGPLPPIVDEGTPQHVQGRDTSHEIDEGAAYDLMIQELAALPKHTYERTRKSEAKGLGVRVSVLDKEVEIARKQNDDVAKAFPSVDVEPWPEEIVPDELLTLISDTIHRFIVCKKEVADAVTLWGAMSWFIDVMDVAPLAIITAPEKRCGKSNLLTILDRLSRRPVMASNYSSAAMFRIINEQSPTLLLDECDTFVKGDEFMRGILNSGYKKESAFLYRTGHDGVSVKFNTWGAKALTGIGNLADTIMDRAIVFRLKRKLPNEKVERLQDADPNLFKTIQSKLARFALDYSDQVRHSKPLLPSILNDRAQDNWEPLLKIAMVTGGNWTDNAIKSAHALSMNDDVAESVGTELLANIREKILSNEIVYSISSKHLVKILCEDKDSRWSRHKNNSPITQIQLAHILGEYDIKSQSIRVGDSTPKGYYVAQFEDAFDRYLPPEPVIPLLTESEPVADCPVQSVDVADENNDNMLES